MSLNGISTLATKELRQIAKLNLASQDRELAGNLRRTYIIEDLPTRYDGNDVVDNPNVGGLIVGRPWVDAPPYVGHQITLENGNTLGTEAGDTLIAE